MSLNEISQAEAGDEAAAGAANLAKAALVKGRIELSTVAGIFPTPGAIGAVGGIEFAGLLFPAVFHDAAGFEKMGHPVVIRLVLLNSGMDAERQLQMKIGSNGFLCALDHPLDDCRSGVFQQILGVILDVTLAADFGVKGNYD